MQTYNVHVCVCVVLLDLKPGILGFAEFKANVGVLEEQRPLE